MYIKKMYTVLKKKKLQICLKGQYSTRLNCFQLRLWGFRLGPTDVTHPLLTIMYCPFNLLLLRQIPVADL